MLRLATATAVVLLAACSGRSDEEALHDAANQSNPAAAEVLDKAAENGMDPQEALAVAGQAQVANGAGAEPRSLQAKPNLPDDPNRPEAGEAPAKIETGDSAANQRAGQDTQ